MKITEFFDPLDINHLTAYQHLQKKGAWPEGFINFDELEFEPNWQMILQSKMADLWVGANIAMYEMQTKNLFNMDKLLEVARDFDKSFQESNDEG